MSDKYSVMSIEKFHLQKEKAKDIPWPFLLKIKEPWKRYLHGSELGIKNKEPIRLRGGDIDYEQ